MRAIGVNVVGGPDALEVLDLPEPHAGPWQIRIRVAAAAVNRTDAVRCSVRRQEVDPPWVPGMDIAGTVDEVGDGAGDLLAAGDHAVFALQPDAVLPVARDGRRVATVRGHEGAPERGITRHPVWVHGTARRREQRSRPAAALPRPRPRERANRSSTRIDWHVPAAPPTRTCQSIVDSHRLARSGGPAHANVPVDRPLASAGTVVAASAAPEPAELGRASRPGQRTIAEHREKLDALRELASAGGLTPRVAGTWAAQDAQDACRALEAGGLRERAC